jgi:hypothetical protein
MVQLILTSISVHKIMSAGQPCTLLLDVQKYVTQLKLSKLPSLCSCRLLGIVNLDSCTIQNKTCTPRHRWILPCEGPESGSQKFQTPATFEKAEVAITEHDNERTRWKQYQQHLYCATRQVEALYQKPASQPAIYLRHKVGQHFRFRTLDCLLTNPLSPGTNLRSLHR